MKKILALIIALAPLTLHAQTALNTFVSAEKVAQSTNNVAVMQSLAAPYLTGTPVYVVAAVPTDAQVLTDAAIDWQGRSLQISTGPQAQHDYYVSVQAYRLAADTSFRQHNFTLAATETSEAIAQAASNPTQLLNNQALLIKYQERAGTLTHVQGNTAFVSLLATCVAPLNPMTGGVFVNNYDPSLDTSAGGVAASIAYYNSIKNLTTGVDQASANVVGAAKYQINRLSL